MATERGRLLLLLASDKPQSAAALANAAHEDPAETRLGLVLTDTFNRVPGAALVEIAEGVQAAGATPVVLFTAHRVHLDAARAAGFPAVLNKPFDLEHFIATVRELLPP